MQRKTGLRRIEVDNKLPVFTTQTEWGDTHRFEYGAGSQDCPKCGRTYGAVGQKSFLKHAMLCDGPHPSAAPDPESARVSSRRSSRNKRPRLGVTRPTVASIAHRHFPESVYDGNTNHYHRHGPTHYHATAISRVPVHPVDRVIEPQMTTNHCTNCGRNIDLSELRDHMETCLANYAFRRKAAPPAVSLPRLAPDGSPRARRLDAGASAAATASGGAGATAAAAAASSASPTSTHRLPFAPTITAVEGAALFNTKQAGGTAWFARGAIAEAASAAVAAEGGGVRRSPRHASPRR